MDARSTRLSLAPPTPGDTIRPARRLLTGGTHRFRLTGEADRYVYPVLFVPGIMGTRLRIRGGEKAWDPDDKLFMLWDYGLLDGDAKRKTDRIVGPSGIHSEQYLEVDAHDLLHNLALALDIALKNGAVGDKVKGWLEHLVSLLLIGGGRPGVPAAVLGAGVGGIGWILQKLDGIVGEPDTWFGPDIADIDPMQTGKRWAKATGDAVREAQQASGPHQELLRGVGELLAPHVGKGTSGLLTALAYVLERNLGGLYWTGYSAVVGELSSPEFAASVHDRMRTAIRERMKADGAEAGAKASDEALNAAAERAASRVHLPVYGCGYNWSNSNRRSGQDLAAFIDDVMDRYDRPGYVCEGVFLVTHSMGGLVARSACVLHGAARKVVGVVHGVQPATGSPAPYWRMKGGTEQPLLLQTTDNMGLTDSDPNAKDLRVQGKSEASSVSAARIAMTSVEGRIGSGVLGVDGREFTPLLALLPGPMELLCTALHTTNEGLAGWIRIVDLTGKAPDRAIAPLGQTLRWKPVSPEEALSADGQPPEAGAREVRFPTSPDQMPAEVVLAHDRFWMTVDEPELLVPAGTRPDGTPVPPNPAKVTAALAQYRKLFLEQTHPFHTELGAQQHARSAHFYGGGNSEGRSFRWVRKRGPHDLPEEDQSKVVPGKEGSELELVVTETADQVVFLITPYTWHDAGAAWTQDLAEKTGHGIMNLDLSEAWDHVTGAGSTAAALVGDPRERARAAAGALTADATGTASADGAAGALSGGAEALQAGRVALAAGQDALDAAAELVGKTRRALGALLRATQEAVTAGQDAAASAADAIDAAQRTLAACEAVLDALGDASETAEATFAVLLDETLRALETDGKEAVAAAVHRALQQGRAAAREAVDSGQKALRGASASAEEAAQLAASAAQKAVGAGKQAFHAGQSALADGLQAAERAAGGADAAAREALQAAATALDAISPALQAALRALAQAGTGAQNTVGFLTAAVHSGRRAYAAAERLLADEAEHDGSAPTRPAQDLLVLLRTASACLLAAAAAAETARRTAEGSAEACAASIHAAEQVAEHAARAAGTAAHTFRNVFAATERSLDLTLDRSRNALDLAVTTFEGGLDDALRTAEQSAQSAETSVAETWDALQPAVADALRAGGDRFARAPEAIARSAWEEVQRALSGRLREALDRSVGESRSALDAVLAEARAFLAAAHRTRRAGRLALSSARRLVAVGEQGLHDVLFGAEAVGEKATRTTDKASAFGGALRNVGVREDPAAPASASASAKVSGRLGLRDPAAVLGPRGEYADGRVHIRRYRGGYDAFFTADDGTVLKATLQPPAGDGDGSVPRSSGKHLFTQQLTRASDPKTAAAKLDGAFADLAHEPAYKTWPARSFTMARLLDFLCEEEPGPGAEPPGPVRALATAYRPVAE